MTGIVAPRGAVYISSYWINQIAGALKLTFKYIEILNLVIKERNSIFFDNNSWNLVTVENR